MSMMSIMFIMSIRPSTVISLSNGKLLVGWGKRVWCSEPPAGGPAFYFPDFFLEDPLPWCWHEYMDVFDPESLIAEGDQGIWQWIGADRAFFEETFEELQKKFAAGELKKAVPFVFEEALGTPSEEQWHHSLHHVLNYVSQAPAFAYGFWEQGQGMLGATPELLFRMNGERLSTAAVAGTCRRDEPDKDLLNDPKEREEHACVVTGISDYLSQFGDVIAGETGIVDLPKLSHLVTLIEVNLRKEVQIDQIVQALHPTPALGAFPREEGRQWLLDYQTKIPRGRFGAPIGYRFEGETACYVAIRNMQWDHHTTRVSAGCGIVPASDLNAEWEEIQLKLAATKQLLGI